jgi:hypothetical protein
VNGFAPFGKLGPSAFPPTSRYATTETATLDAPNGEHIVYLKRRIVPPSSRFALLVEHRVQDGDRLDNIAAGYLGDPEQFWQICDANDAIDPDDLTGEPGRLLRITLPAGIPGGGG